MWYKHAMMLCLSRLEILQLQHLEMDNMEILREIILQMSIGPNI